MNTLNSSDSVSFTLSASLTPCCYRPKQIKIYELEQELSGLVVVQEASSIEIISYINDKYTSIPISLFITLFFLLYSFWFLLLFCLLTFFILLFSFTIFLFLFQLFNLRLLNCISLKLYYNTLLNRFLARIRTSKYKKTSPVKIH